MIKWFKNMNWKHEYDKLKLDYTKLLDQVKGKLFDDKYEFIKLNEEITELKLKIAKKEVTIKKLQLEMKEILEKRK